MIEAHTASGDATRELAATLARTSRAGDLLLLAGDLGAGKTAFAQGFAQGLGVTDPVTSPTFTIARQYQGRLGLHHLDVYRLEHLNDVFDADLPELLEDDAVTLIEWGDVIAPVVPADYLEVRITFGPGNDDRVLTLRCVGPRWAARHRSLREVLAPWAGGEHPC
ncbi:tRNA (adenosine(37)-N6)-threonylcarbamoyltransferase complex ATPase subunit type 1 TsaE [soil metagenome]